ncbi:hypothetical protein CKM354_000048400 [Cercospora kikuchii]|uniref:PUM-HD domain-containing protein n=1 Tax=Cercospora kikuchii TaxID=84275 RepID=A0A9P3F7A2_9PEZI|nr:uncharacterized protein CKM354_000048400 [Cercospora kikuchii]GIZ37021.1 hypothetical protein CKM354_000048400 [Cercospora kikuchii]
MSHGATGTANTNTSMAFTNAARSFNGARSTTTTEKKSNTNGIVKPAATGNTWGGTTIWSSGANGFAMPSLARENSSSREHNPQPLTAKAAEDIEGKTGSGSLVESSISEEYANRSWAKRGSIPGRTLSSGLPNDNILSQQRSGSNAGLQAMSGASQNLMGFGTRPPTINLNQTGQPRPRYSSAFELKNDFSVRSSEQPPFNVYTKFDRPIDPSHRKSELTNGYTSSATQSPSDDRRPPFSSQYSRNASMPTSRDGSLPSSRGAEEPPSFTRPDYGRSSQRATPNNSRAPSMSSGRNGAYNPYFNVDHVASNMQQFSFNGENRSPSTYKPTNGFQGSHPGAGSRPSTQAGNNFYHNHDDIIDELDRASAHYLDMEDFAAAPPANHYQSSLAERYINAGGLAEFRPGQPFVTGAAARSHDVSAGLRSPSEWSGFCNGVQMANRRSPAADNNPYMSAHVQQLMAAQLRSNPYASLYNPYALQINPHFMQLMPINTMGLEVPTTPRDSPIGESVQSALMYEFKSNTKNKRWELRDIRGHVAEFAGDQHGSRFIQTKLETANSDDKDMVFNEIDPNAIPLMTDVFGNYVIQKFFEHGDQRHKKRLAKIMHGQVLSLSLQMYGCRVVQKALDHLLVDDQTPLVLELDNHVLKCVKDQNGNHVIQKAIERCPAANLNFIVAAFRAQVQHLSIHPYGCRVIQRCLEKSDLPNRALVMSELMQGVNAMISDQFGNYVVQHIVSHDHGEGKQQVLTIVAQGLEGYSKHKFSSNVVEKCLERSDDVYRNSVMTKLLDDNARRTEGEGVLLGMIRDSYGNYVIQKFLDVLEINDYFVFCDHLQAPLLQAKRSGAGKQVLAIEKKMHRFDHIQRNGNINHGGHFHMQSGSGYQMPMQIAMTVAPYASNYNSAATTPPPLTADTQSLQSSCLPSINGDAVEGAAASRKGSDPSSMHSIDGVHR